MAPPPPDDALIDCCGLWFRYPGSDWVLRDCDLRVAAGERILLRGPNGCGKSTLLGILAHLQRPSRGHCRRCHETCQCVALLSQQSDIDPSLPVQVRDVVACGWRSTRPWWLPRGRGADRAVAGALATVGLADEARNNPGALSGGQQRRMLIARSLVQGARLLLFDEPLSGLDRDARQALAQVLEQTTGPGRAALVMVSHEVADCPLTFDRDLHFADGRLIPTAEAHCELVTDRD